MISRQAVVDACLTRLQTVEAATTLATAPTGTPALYGVLEVPPGPVHDDGDQADRHRHLLLNVRVRSVARHSDLSVATQAALDLAGRYTAALLDPTVEIAGTGWVVGDRNLAATSGAELEGQVANVIDDYELWVVPAAIPPE